MDYSDLSLAAFVTADFAPAGFDAEIGPTE